MTLRKICKKVLMDEVLGPSKEPHKWKVLIADDIGMKILTACFTTIEVLRQNISLIDYLYKKRGPLQCLEAIYIISPVGRAIEILLSDFQLTKCMYACAHVFFLHDVPDDLSKLLRNSRSKLYIKTIKAINIAFNPIESQVFNLHEINVLRTLYTSNLSLNTRYCDLIAEKIATLCATLGVCPVIQYSRRLVSNSVLAESVYKKIQIMERSSPLNEKTPTSHLLILDRGFDCITPLLHEFTLQAMVYDVLPVVKGMLHLIPPAGANAKPNAKGQGRSHEILLDEIDEFWKEHRHKHLAAVADEVAERMKQFQLEEATSALHIEACTDESLKRISKDMGNIIRLEEKLQYSNYKSMVEACLDIFKNKVKDLSELEQDLATKSSRTGEALKHVSKTLVRVLSDENYSEYSKLRIIMLFILYNDGISSEAFEALLWASKLTSIHQQILTNFEFFGCSIFKKSGAPVQQIVPRKERDVTYSVSRWTPVLKDIMELLIENKLDEQNFPYIVRPTKLRTLSEIPGASWYCEDDCMNDVVNLIVFITGGITYSEMRCAYEVTKAHKGWQVIVGSDEVLTPDSFLHEVGQMSGTAV